MTALTVETRLLLGAQLRASDEGDERGFEGCLVPYGKWAPIGGLFEERMARGVFNKSIREAASALPLMAMHDHQKFPIGKAVEWDDRADGLHGRWVMADSDNAREAHTLIRDGMLSGLSCGFQPVKDGDEWQIADPPKLSRVTRKIARLVEASVVPIPTWQDAVITNTRSSVGAMTLAPHREAWAKWLDGIRQG